MAWEDESQGGKGQIQTISRPKTKTTRPSMYKVILLNDDYTPMDFVIQILRKFFNKAEADATQIMLQVHHKGAGLAGVFTFEVAETKVFQVNNFSRKHQHPLRCIMEKEAPAEEKS